MLLASSRGDEVPQIAENLGCGQQTVRDAIHDFNRRGIAALEAGSSRPKHTRDAFDEESAEALREMLHQTWLRFVDGRPVSSITRQFLGWCAEKLEEIGKKVLLIIWDNASWHISRELRRWVGKHNREVKTSGDGVRIVSCLLPKKSPWLNAIEPKWVHGKRKVVEPEGLLGAYELADRVCRVFGCPHYEHLSVPRKVA